MMEHLETIRANRLLSGSRTTRRAVFYTDNKIVMCEKAHSLKSFLSAINRDHNDVNAKMGCHYKKVEDGFYDFVYRRFRKSPEVDYLMHISTDDMKRLFKELSSPKPQINQFISLQNKKEPYYKNEDDYGRMPVYHLHEVAREMSSNRIEHNHFLMNKKAICLLVGVNYKKLND